MAESGKYAIRVAVKSTYLAEQSDPSRQQYVFAYTVTITNAGSVAAQLVSRHWIITDAEHQVQEVKGLGGSDEVYGGAGDDVVSGDSHKGPAADVVDGGPGFDRIDQDWNDLSGAPVTLTLGGGADDGRPGEGDDVRNVEKVISFNPVAGRPSSRIAAFCACRARSSARR